MSASGPASASDGPDRAGLAYGIAGYGLWGLAPLFWRQLYDVPAPELLAHRLVWACVFFVGWLAITGRLRSLREAWNPRRVALRLAASAAFVAFNWFVFVYAVLVDRVLDVSLGYFINPLMSVAMGRLFLGERLRRLQAIAVGVAFLGIAIMAVRAGGLPWIALAVSISFATYGLIRKTTEVSPAVGSTFETILLFPLGAAYLVWLHVQGGGALGGSGLGRDLLLAAAGPVTAVPLLLFVNAARRLPLSMVGFLQYLAPSIQFVLAVTVLGEAFPPSHVVAFALVWVALAAFTYDGVSRARRNLL